MNNEEIRNREGIDILIVEDSATQAEELRFLLEQENHQVRVAANGRLALAAVREHQPTMIITDVVMPEMDGYELCTALKADPVLKAIPVVMVTSLSGIQDIAKSLECGADNFIRKPYAPKTLLARIEYILLNLELRKSSRVRMGMEIYLSGQKHFITSGREQIVDLLISTYEEAVNMNEEMKAQQREIALANRTLRMLYRIAADLNRAGSEAEVCERALQGILELPEFHAAWVCLDEGSAPMRTFGTAPPADTPAPAPAGHASLTLTVGEQDLGVLHVVGADNAPLAGEALRMLQALASQLAVALQRSQLQDHLETLVVLRTRALRGEIQERVKAEQKVASLNRVYAVLSGINGAIVRVHERLELFKEACRIAVELGHFRLAWIGTVEADGTRLRPLAWQIEGEAHDDCDQQFAAAQRDPLDAQMGWIGQALRERSVAVCKDMAAQSGEFFPPDLVTRGCRSQAVFPLRVSGGTAAVLVLCATEPDFFANEMELDLLKEMAGDIAFALEYIGKTEQLDYLAYYDAVTGLANHNLIQDRLNQLLQDDHRAAGEHSQIGLVLLDVERFKNINDTFGRHVGDILLKRVAGRLAEALGGPDRLARLGNAHFAVILAELTDAAEVARLLDDIILPSLNQPFTVEGKELHLTIRTGVALFPSDGGDAEALFAHAETALRMARTNEERYMFYASPMNARVTQQLLLENKLRRALERKEFVLYYQPKVSLFDGGVVGLEALIRWNDPQSGLVPPGEFIPLLEETGMIVEVGRWVLEQALADITAWQASGLAPPRVAVNVSTMQLRRKDFVRTLENVLTNHHGHIRRMGLDLELTESVLMMDVDASIQKLNAIRDMDLKISIDDFGTGFSSLSYLKRFPIDYLKIDQSFVRDITTDPNAAAICISIIDLAHNLKMKVVAEGVETEGQMNYLRRHHCDEMQGYLFSRPLPNAECTQLLTSQRKLALPPPPDGERKTLLIVDDETSILSALKRLLRRDGYEILTADNAAAGFDLLATHEVQVVVSDQRMPTMNGTEFLSRVKDLYPQTVRIVLSGYTDLDSITGAVNRGAIYKFFTKPWEDEAMRDNIRDAFATYETRRERQDLSY
jgi:diguanylate cyclase (GGDEF)-like protein